MNPIPRNYNPNMTRTNMNRSCAPLPCPQAISPVCKNEATELKKEYAVLSKHQLMKLINQYSFAVDDIILYLDTHPDDEDALDYFQTVMLKRNILISIYSEKYDTLLLDYYEKTSPHIWDWIMKPWPWEIDRKGDCN